MKLSIVVLAATLAVASAVDCDVTKVAPLLSDPNIATCTADSGFSFTALSAPTAETLPKLCASTACKTVLGAVKGLGLGDCTLLGMKLESELITPIQTACAKSAANSTSTSTTATKTSGSTAGSSAGAATVGSTTTATTAPTVSAAAGSSSGASASTVDTPAATTTTPAPTKSAAASSVAVAASAVVLAVAASLF